MNRSSNKERERARGEVCNVVRYCACPSVTTIAATKVINASVDGGGWKQNRRRAGWQGPWRAGSGNAGHCSYAMAEARGRERGMERGGRWVQAGDSGSALI